MHETILKPESMAQVLEIFGPQSSDKPVEADSDSLEAVQEIKDLDKEIKLLEQRKQFLKNKLAAKMLNSAYLIGQDGDVKVTWKTYETQSFNHKRFMGDYPELAERYIEHRPNRKMIIK